MCRAVWVVVVGRDATACTALRRACGLEAQVVGAATSGREAVELLATTRADAVVIDAAAPGASEELASLRERAPDAAIVWIGEDAPAGAHEVADGDDLGDRLPSEITRALIARRRPQPPSPPISTSG